ncbi:MAG: FeoB-associated Cys-rich membrane protein [Firmicutes bacterium]|nr:FeoB-associated Cys-rich membrane protein [Bacillota bacterium]
MINYILGGLIAAFTIYIIVRQIKKLKAGQCSCGHDCPGCAGQCGTEKKE